ncbi:MAG TPA: hypothetical protein VLD58_11730, partial [Gemmatimonadales bacterium]|nr:hypothetical protein [Gemmatimonadales bacterium]
FTGPTAQAVIAKVMTTEPVSLTSQRKSVPPAVDDAVLTALQKLPADRFATAAEFALALAGGRVPGTATGAVRAAHSGPGPWRAIALGLGVLSVGLLVLALRAAGRNSRAGPTVYDAVLPDSATMSFAVTSSNVAYGEPLRNISIAPAGDFAVYAARQGDSTELWYRSLRDGETHRLNGTQGGTAPRLSPDGTRVAFLRGDRVMLLSLAGGEPRQLLEGGSTDALGWLSNTQVGAGTDDGNKFNWIDAAGGNPRTRVIARCPFGRWIPDLARLVCSYNRNGFVLDPESGAIASIRAARPDGSAGELVAGTAFYVVDRRYLVYLSTNGTLLGARFDAEKQLAYRPVTLLTGLRREALGEGQFDISANGTLVYAPGIDATIGRLVTLHAAGVPQPLPMESGDFQRFDLSRDRRWVAASVQGSESNELRVYDLQNGQHFTWQRGGTIRHPLWSPAGDRLLYALRDSTRWAILRGAPGSGARPDTLASSTYDSFSLDPTDYQGEHLALAQSWGGSVVTRFDPGAPRAAFDTLVTGARFASVSPSQKLILYQTLDGNEVIATRLDMSGRRWQLASEGVEPLWLSPTEVLYRLGIAWYLVKLNPETGEPLGPPAFWNRDSRFSDTSGWSNRPSHDGGIIYVQGPSQNGSAYLRVIPDWVRQMKAAVDSAGR